MVVLHELRCVIRERVGHTAGKGVRAAPVIFRPLRIQLFAQFIAGILVHGVEISAGRHTAHVIHGRGHRRLYTRIYHGSVDGHAAPSADAEDTDTLRIRPLTGGKEVHRRAEILGIYVRRSHITWLSAALPRI